MEEIYFERYFDGEKDFSITIEKDADGNIFTTIRQEIFVSKEIHKINSNPSDLATKIKEKLHGDYMVRETLKPF